MLEAPIRFSKAYYYYYYCNDSTAVLNYLLKTPPRPLINCVTSIQRPARSLFSFNFNCPSSTNSIIWRTSPPSSKNRACHVYKNAHIFSFVKFVPPLFQETTINLSALKDFHEKSAVNRLVLGRLLSKQAFGHFDVLCFSPSRPAQPPSSP